MRLISMRSQSCLGMMAGLLGILVVSPTVRATYNYSVEVAPSSQMFGGATLTLTGNSFGGLNGTNTVNLALLTVDTVTQPPAIDTIDLPYTLQVTLTDPADPGQMAVFQVAGELTGTANSDHSVLDNTYTSVMPASLTLGNNSYKLDVGPIGVADVYFTPPTVNGVAGALGGRIAVTEVPEPTSLGLLLCAAACLLLRRRPRRTVARAESGETVVNS